MPLSLYDAAIPAMLQILGAGQGWLDKAQASSLSEEEIAEARLIEDMLPFAYQVKSMWLHSRGAITGLRAGTFSPDSSEPPRTLAAMRDKLREAEDFLKTLSPGEVDAFIGQDMLFEAGEKRLPFTGEDFLLSFSVPNFFFHATTAYGILRAKGVPVGKLDYIGKLRVKQG